MRNVNQSVVGVLIGFVALGWGLASRAQTPSSSDVEFFEKKIRPVLSQQCYKCHSASAKKLKGNLLLDSREGMLKGGETGAAVTPGKPDQSLLIKAVRWTDKDLQMPPKEQLPKDVVADFERWVSAGAVWPGEGTTPVATAGGGNGTDATPNHAANYDHLRKELWSWQPVTNPPAPEVKNPAWAVDDIDRFVLGKLDERGLEPSPRADKLALLRRATYDLIGLPPTPDEIDSYLRDNSPDAFAKVVDRLLDSPRFGERWGRHWLDVARYAESSGMSRNYIYFYAWRYRDYVIDAFNKDKPYNRFIREQIAGDLLPSKTSAEKDQLLVATGFLAVGPRDFNERNPQQFQMNGVDEQIDTVGRAIMGTTIACARCHDHKFDPIPTAEYYSLAGIFTSSDEFTGIDRRRGARQDPYTDDHLIKLAGYAPEREKKEADADETRQQARRAYTRMIASSKFGQGYTQPSTPPRKVAMGVRDDVRPEDIRILARGEIDHPGDRVKRGFLSIPSMGDVPAVSSGESGRLELALWLTRQDNPLTARVMVNRIWQHLFGVGLVRSVDNFGTTGDKPTHPELLDHLATQFMKDGWSVKHMIRSVMMSSTYQQAATFDRAKYNVDPDNRLLWRMNQRRLEAEAIRDGILAASGKLTTQPPVGSVALDLPPVEIRGGRFNPGEILAGMNFRSVYLPVFRNAVPEALEAFDFADPNTVSGARDVTTVAPQALFMLNNAFVTSHAQAMAYRVATQAAKNDGARVDLTYKLALGRPASSTERERAVAYVWNYLRDPVATRGKTEEKAKLDAWASLCQAMMSSAEFRYLN